MDYDCICDMVDVIAYETMGLKQNESECEFYYVLSRQWSGNKYPIIIFTFSESSLT